jgi:hypothetical protein
MIHVILRPSLRFLGFEILLGYRQNTIKIILKDHLFRAMAQAVSRRLVTV